MSKMEDDLRSRLSRVVPETPAVDQWAAIVRSRASTRRRRHTAGAVALAVFVTAGLLLIPNLINRDTAGIGPETSPPTHLSSIADGCPAVDTTLPFPDDATLPHGATAVRLCNGVGDSCYCGPNDDRIDTGFQAPREALTSDTDTLVDLVNDAKGPPDGDPVACAGTGGNTHVFWFLYPDGDARAVSYLSGSCLDLIVGTNDVRYGGRELLAQFSDLLVAQRQETSPPGETRVATCDSMQPTSRLVVSTVDFSTAVYCVADERGQWQQAALSSAEVALINQDYSIEEVTQTRSCPTMPRTSMIVGYTPWGDLVAISAECDNFYGPGSYWNNGINRAWRPSQAVLDMLNSRPLEPLQKQ